jgi:hypothetical protein
MDSKIVASYLSSISKAMVVARRAAPSYVAPAFQRPPLSRGGTSFDWCHSFCEFKS